MEWAASSICQKKKKSVTTWYLQLGFEEIMFGKYCSAQKRMRSQRKKDRLLCDAVAMSALAWVSVLEFQGDKASPHSEFWLQICIHALLVAEFTNDTVDLRSLG